MPVGIDTDIFKGFDPSAKYEKSVLFLGRISPVKKVEMFVNALSDLHGQGIGFTASIYGDPTDSDAEYYQRVRGAGKELEGAGMLSFYPGVPYRETSNIYNQHALYVNFTQSGSMDKTIFEAMACEMPVLVSNRALKDVLPEPMVFEEDDVNDFKNKLINLLTMDVDRRVALGKGLREIIIREHSLDFLIERLMDNFYPDKNI
ncbi:MAG: glycosyltransferase family 4 protein [Patescibacteria group bacterium]|nr:glycosyltransferase family 4 protein [Patescibacteria group bacterium]